MCSTTSALPSRVVSRSATTDTAGAALVDRPVPSIVVYTSPLEATTTWRAWPTLSAKMLAQIPAGSVRPALSPAHFAGVESALAVLALALSEPDFSPELQAANASGIATVESVRRTIGEC